MNTSNFFILNVTFYPSDQFKCRNGTCIPKEKRCNGRFDCLYFSGELNCSQVNCDTLSQFKCSSGSCVSLAWCCDTEKDCGDASDESNCTMGQCDPLII